MSAEETKVNDRGRHQLVAVVVVILSGSEILAMRRASHKVGAGLWETGSGRVEIGEDPLLAVQREIAEETGLSVRLDERPLDVYAARRGDEPMTVIAYRAQHLEGDVKLSDEHDEYAWLSLQEFRERTTLDRLVLAVERALAAAH